VKVETSLQAVFFYLFNSFSELAAFGISTNNLSLTCAVQLTLMHMGSVLLGGFIAIFSS